MVRGFLSHSDLYVLKNTLDLGFESENFKEKTFVDSPSHNTNVPSANVAKTNHVSANYFPILGLFMSY